MAYSSVSDVFEIYQIYQNKDLILLHRPKASNFGKSERNITDACEIG